MLTNTLAILKEEQRKRKEEKASQPNETYLLVHASSTAHHHSTDGRVATVERRTKQARLVAAQQACLCRYWREFVL